MSAAPDRSRIARYLEVLQSQRHLSPHTLVNYRRDLDELAGFLEAMPDRPAFARTTPVHIRKCIAQMHARGLSARSIARKLSAWRGFFDWLAEQETLAQNPVAGVKAPKRDKPLPKALSPDHAVQLVSARVGAPDSPAALCDRAMFELLYSSGLRVSELTSLDVQATNDARHGHVSAGWLDLQEGTVTVTGKGAKMRSVPVGGPAIAAIRDWLAVRGQLLKADPHPLFLSARGTRMTPRAVQKRIKAHAIRAGVPADVHPHMLRHSFASHVLQSSGDLRAVQEMLGHASIASTQIYTALDFQHLAKIYDAAHPRAKKK